MKKPFVLIVVLCFAVSCILSACESPAPEVTFDEKQESLFAAFTELDSVTVKGKIVEDDKETALEGTVDKKNKAISMRFGNESFFYYARTLFRAEEEGYAVFDVTQTYATFLQRLAFSAFLFTYDPDDCESSEIKGDTLVVAFGGAGVKRCFASDRAVYGGTFLLTFSGDVILSSRLTTELPGGKILSAEYEYGVGAPVSLDVNVLPSDGIPYAVYASTKLIAANDRRTLHTESGDKNTGVTVDGILPVTGSEYLTPDDVASAFVIDSDPYVTLHVAYKSAKTVIGLGSAVREVAITFRRSPSADAPAYTATLIQINDGIRYVLA